MVRIRKASYLDKFRFKKMISFLSNEAINHYTKVFQFFPLNFMHELLPLKLKFLPESYVIQENNDILGMVTLSPTTGNPYKLAISRLFLEQDYYNAGKQLIDFVVSRYGAKGASNFIANIDASHDELLHLFTEGCGFRQCSSEQLWKMNEICFSETGGCLIRPFKNSDSKAAAMLYNDSVITHFRHSISRTKDEYLEPFFKGLEENYKFKYVIEDESLKTLKAYFSISTADNTNFILDVTSSAWYDPCWEDILEYAVNQISSRKKDFYLFVKVKKYTNTAESFEKYLQAKGFNCVQNHIILVKDFYKLIKEPQQARKIVLFGEINEKPVFKV